MTQEKDLAFPADESNLLLKKIATVTQEQTAGCHVTNV